MKKRSEIEEKFKWDLTDYFKDDNAWQQEFNQIKPLYKKLQEYEGKLFDDNVFLECLKLESQISERVGRLYVYIALKVKEDGKNSFYQERENLLNKYLSEVAPIKSALTSEINDFSDERLLMLAKDERFKNFDILLKDIIKSKAHMLTKPEEMLLAKVSECIGGESNVFDMYDAVDIKFNDVTDANGQKHPLNNSNYSKYIISNDPILRKTAFKNLNGEYGKLNYTLASNYVNNVITNCTFAKIRKFNSAFEASLFEEDVNETVYKTLIEQVHKNKETFYKYFKLKQKSLNLKTFHNYDVNAKLINEQSKECSYDEAFNIVTDSLSVLGLDYITVLNRAKQERWIDVLPNENKDTGAFAWGAYGAHPVVLLNFEGTINSTFTLAHELGHMMHSYYSNDAQPSTKADYQIFVAEVASTVNEMILAKTYLAKASTKQEKLYYLDYLMNMFYSTIYRQTMFAEFEYKVHYAYENNEPTTTDAINEIYMSLCKEYFGRDVELEPELTYEWSRIPHFYNSFYVYKYATGLISALAISNNILSGDKNAVSSYKQFLRSGSTNSPVELLKIAGVDLTKDQTFNSAFGFANQILKEWEELING